MNVDALMTRSVRMISADTTVGEAWRLLRVLKVSHLPVTNDDGGLVGLVSEADCERLSRARVDALSVTRNESSMVSVRTVMTAARVVIEADDDVEEALDLMTENKITALPVIDSDGAVVGIVSSSHFARDSWSE